MSDCKVILKNFHGSYTTGSIIEGSVICDFSEQKNVRGIKIRLSCKEHSKWNQGKNTRIANHKIFFSECILWGGGNDTFISEGHYEYNFGLELPKGLPSSYKGKYGWIKYRLKAVVDRPFAFDYVHEVYFNVISIVDCNEFPITFKQPCGFTKEEYLYSCSCFGSEGPITLKMDLEKGVYCPGDTIHCRLAVINDSSSNIEFVNFTLDEEVEAKLAKDGLDHRIETKQIAFVQKNGVNSGEERIYDLRFYIPEDVIVYNFVNCELFKIVHKFHVRCGAPLLHGDIHFEIIIILGHIPLMEESNPSEDESTNLMVFQPSAPIVISTTLETPPPTYTQATGEEQNLPFV